MQMYFLRTVFNVTLTVNEFNKVQPRQRRAGIHQPEHMRLSLQLQTNHDFKLEAEGRQMLSDVSLSSAPLWSGAVDLAVTAVSKPPSYTAEGMRRDTGRHFQL